jgi:nicotinamide-nucleotide amidase
MNDEHLKTLARDFLAEAKSRGLKFAAAESCTGGLIAAFVCKIPGSSAVLDRGFVTYSNHAKVEVLGVPKDVLKQHGAVSREVALAMADGALQRSRADLVVAVTGIAGPDGGGPGKPVGLVHLAAARRNGPCLHEEKRFGDLGRERVQAETVAAAFALLGRLL